MKLTVFIIFQHKQAKEMQKLLTSVKTSNRVIKDFYFISFVLIKKVIWM